MSELILYDRPGCHLCEQAMALIASLGFEGRVRAEDVEQDIELLRRYGLRVPVVRRTDSGAELDWPFESTALRQFLEGIEHPSA